MRSSLLSIAALLVACGGAPSPQPTTAPTATPSAPAPAPASDPFITKLNLGFEAATDGKPDGWQSGIAVGSDGVAGYETTLDRDAHGGTHSLRIRANGTGSFGSIAVATDAAPFRGKRVRLHGWVKSDGVTAPGWAGLWLRADGGSTSAFDNMTGRGFTGTEGWREGSAQIDVPADAAQLVLGTLLVGVGTAWFDDLRIEVVDIAEQKPITIAGVVLDPTGKPAPGATVTLMASSGNVVSHVAADADGRFRFDAKSGLWGMSAHHPSGFGTFFDPRELAGNTDDIRLTLERDGVLVRGRVLIEGLVPEGTTVEIAPFSDHQTDGFVIPVGTDGRFEARLPRGDSYWAKAKGPKLIGQKIVERTGDEIAFELPITVLAPPPPAVNAWVAASATPLVSAEAGHGFDDMKRIATMIGKARIVALGEATHGTREIFQLKHRFLEYLVAEHGFTAFIIEANLTECRAINDYVLHGKGDPQQALDGIYFWVWNTEEVLAMIEWMRAWNADPAHEKKVQFFGDDMQFTKVAHANVVGFLQKVAPGQAEALAAPIAIVGEEKANESFAKKPAAEQQAAAEALEKLARRFDRSRAAWSKLAGKEAYLDAREDLRVLVQATAMFRAGAKSFEARDVAMADNVDHILARLPKGTRAVLWAHNGHVANGAGGVKNQGHHLRERHGKDYVVFGFVFGEGSFQAKDWTKGQGTAVTEHALGAPPAWDVSAPFRATRKPIVVVDLRQAPRGVVADWFAAPHPMRQTGAVFTNEANMSHPQQLGGHYDAIIYVDKTTRARPNPGGVRK